MMVDGEWPSVRGKDKGSAKKNTPPGSVLCPGRIEGASQAPLPGPAPPVIYTPRYGRSAHEKDNYLVEPVR